MWVGAEIHTPCANKTVSLNPSATNHAIKQQIVSLRECNARISRACEIRANFRCRNIAETEIFSVLLCTMPIGTIRVDTNV